MTRSIILLSGGIDSTVLLHFVRSLGDECMPLSFNYGQTHCWRELEAAGHACEALRLIHTVAELPGIFKHSALLGDQAMPEGHHSLESMKQTVVPNRNMVFISAAGSFALQAEARVVWIGAHAGDAHTYADCRDSFIRPMAEALHEATEGKVLLMAPFLPLNKKQIVEMGRSLGVDLDKTWSCYRGGEAPCGKCGACSARAEALSA